MRNIYNIILGIGLILGLASCSEVQPMFVDDCSGFKYFTPANLKANTTIKELKSMYQNEALTINKDIIIKGQITTTDEYGNFYRSFYIQDATGAIEVKIGKTSLYNDYKVGQWIYIKCNGLTLGSYNGMINLGFQSADTKYETSYIDAQPIIDTHIFRGNIDKPLSPIVLNESDLSNPDYYGCYVKLENVVYGAVGKENGMIFSLVYQNPKGDVGSNTNRYFLSNQTYGVNTWAMSKQGFISYLEAGNFNNVQRADRETTMGDQKAVLLKNAQAYSVSQYFIKGNTNVQVRTSGYAKFADKQISQEVINGEKAVSLIGILSIYKSDIQFTLNNYTDCVIEN